MEYVDRGFYALVLGIIFGITTKKLAWYVPSGIVVGVIVAITLNKK